MHGTSGGTEAARVFGRAALCARRFGFVVRPKLADDIGTHVVVQPAPGQDDFGFGTNASTGTGTASQIDAANEVLIVSVADLENVSALVIQATDAGTVTLPLHEGRMADGRSVWYVLTDVSDQRLAQKEGLNYSPKLANAPDAELPTLLLGLLPSAPGATARVAVGRDTRPSGPALLDALTAGVQALGPHASIIDLGLRTTPELHFAVDAINRGVWAGDDTYTAHLAAAFVAVLEGAPNGGCPRAPLVVDAANGIGARAMARLAAQLHATEHLRGWPIAVCNTDGVLNAGCGADFVKTGQCAPAGVASNTHSHFATLDGDADRLLYFFFDAGGAFRLLDGDRIAVLLALWLERLLAASGLRAALSLGIVQTAYANGAATSHCRDALHVDVALACTGVKHLHHVAAERFDIGIYFEANGHGTVLFGPRARTLIAAQGTPTLRALLRLVNPCVGDAISDLLVVEAALLHLGLTLDAWLALYTELPSRLLKVCVPDRAAYETCDADTRLTRPPHLQARIDALVHSVPQGRAFVRPSGTEDVVRVYAEAADTDACDQLAQAVAALLF